MGRERGKGRGELRSDPDIDAGNFDFLVFGLVDVSFAVGQGRCCAIRGPMCAVG